MVANRPVAFTCMMTRLPGGCGGPSGWASLSPSISLHSDNSLLSASFALSFSIPDMSLNKLGVIASLVLAASAVLPPLPPHAVVPDGLRESYAAEGHGIQDLQLDLRNRTVALNCPGCAFATQEDAAISWKENEGNTFVSSLPQS
jgi:hypothetical protein